MSDHKHRIDDDLLPRLLRMVESTREVEMPCDHCLEQVHELAESHLRGETVPQALQLVQHHIDGCQDCKVEYTILLQALEAIRDELG